MGGGSSAPNFPRSFTIFSWVYADFNCSKVKAVEDTPGGSVCEGVSSCLSDVVHCDAIGVGKLYPDVCTGGRVVVVSPKPT